MTTFTVNTTFDDVDGNYSFLSLREAVTLANATVESDTIQFAPAVEGHTLFLDGGELTLSQDIVINGEGVTLDGGGYSRLLNITGGHTDATIDHLTLVDGANNGEVVGDYVNGGGVYLGSGNSLAMLGCAIRGCHPGSYGGSAAAQRSLERAALSAHGTVDLPAEDQKER